LLKWILCCLTHYVITVSRRIFLLSREIAIGVQMDSDAGAGMAFDLFWSGTKVYVLLARFAETHIVLRCLVQALPRFGAAELEEIRAIQERNIHAAPPVDWLQIKIKDRHDIGDGFIDLCFKGQTARCRTQEIARVTVKQGVITLRRTDAKSGFFGIGSSGIFSFDYAGLGNARLFCFLLDHLVGVDFS
jgi:hypothetical protein